MNRNLVLLCCFACFLLSLFSYRVDALSSDNVYINSNGVEMDIYYYDKLCDVYSEYFVETLDKELYEELIIYIDDVIVEQSDNYFELGLLSTTHTTNYKSIKFVKNGNFLTLMLDWFKNPVIHSYDVIGMRLDGDLTYNTNFSFYQKYDDGISYDYYDNLFDNGFGCSFLLKDGSSNEIAITFKVTGSGIVYGSYQHAKSTTYLVVSKNYTLSSSGFGGVFNFGSNAKSIYDGMGGVSISV